MDMENGGLDAQVEQRMDAYRGNPQKLQQRYGQNKELLDLLALQKLTSEKKAASRDMQMQMQQQPGTIAQQREQEALDLTKEEMRGTLGDLAGRTKGTLDNKQMMQQKNMQQMAQSASQPPQGGIASLGGRPAAPAAPAGPPQSQGIAGVRMAQAQQRPPVRMAQGGIVSFAEGQGVTGQAGLQGEKSLQEKIAIINAQPELNQLQKFSLIKQIMAQEPKPEWQGLPSMVPVGRESSARMPGQNGLIPAGSGTNALDVMAATNPQIAPLQREPKPEAQRPPSMVPVGRESSARMPGQNGLIPAGSGTNALDVMAATNPQIAPPRPAPAPAPAHRPVPRPAPAPAPAHRPVPRPAPAPAAGGLSALLNQKGETPPRAAQVPTPEDTAAAFTVPQTAGTGGGGGAMPAQSMTNADSAFLKGARMSDEYTGRADANASYEGMKERLAEFDDENYGPNGDLNSFLIGMGGTGSIGSAMSGGYSSMLRNKNNRRNRLMDEFKMEQDRIGTDAVFSASGIKLGTQLAADAAANERSMRAAAATMGAAQIRQATADADRLFNVYNVQLKAAGEQAEALRAREKFDDATALNLLQLAAKTRSELTSEVMADDPMMQRFNMQLQGAAGDKEAMAVAQQNIDTRAQVLSFMVDAMMNDSNLLNLETAAARRFESKFGVPEITEDDVETSTVEGE